METGPVLGAGLATLVHMLEGRRTTLLEDLRQVELDLQAARQTVATADRLGLAIAPEPAIPVTTRPVAPPRFTSPAPVMPPATGRPTDVVPFPQPPQPRPTDFELRSATLAAIGTPRDDAAIPPRLDEHRRQLAAKDLPKTETEMQAVRESVGATVAKAATLPPGPGGRRYVSTRGLIPGEPITPLIRRILKAADRPLSTKEVAVAMLELRGLHYRGRELAGIVNRVSSLLGQDATAGKVGRIWSDEGKRPLWAWARGSTPEP